MNAIKNLNKKIGILNRARITIKTGEVNFVCLAIMRATEDGDVYERGCGKDLRVYIMGEISPYVNLDQWLTKKRPTFKRDKESMKDHRIQWIDWMIGQLQDQIDEVD